MSSSPRLSSDAVSNVLSFVDVQDWIRTMSVSRDWCKAVRRICATHKVIRFGRRVSHPKGQSSSQADLMDESIVRKMDLNDKYMKAFFIMFPALEVIAAPAVDLPHRLLVRYSDSLRVLHLRCIRFPFAARFPALTHLTVTEPLAVTGAVSGRIFPAIQSLSCRFAKYESGVQFLPSHLMHLSCELDVLPVLSQMPLSKSLTHLSLDLRFHWDKSFMIPKMTVAGLSFSEALDPVMQTIFRCMCDWRSEQFVLPELTSLTLMLPSPLLLPAVIRSFSVPRLTSCVLSSNFAANRIPHLQSLFASMQQSMPLLHHLSLVSLPTTLFKNKETNCW